MTMTLHIERLVLDGPADRPVDAASIAEAIRRELTVRIASDGVPRLARTTSLTPAGPGAPPPSAPAATSIGDALYRRLDR